MFKMATGKSKSRSSQQFVEHTNSVLLKKSTDARSETTRLLHHVFRSEMLKQRGKGSFQLDLETLESYLDTMLENVLEENESILATSESQGIGRLGPDHVKFDASGNSGTLAVESDRLGVTSHSNFSTIRANTCVYKGKWVYELLLGSKGVMQLGWCTNNCKFSKEEGVGDTDDSYAYDGNRLRKWNMKTPLKYGQPFLTGDVISCAIDCDKGSITFYRNGVSMGEAYHNIKLGPGQAYFPAVSLSMGENLHANFGATPLRYTIEGYRPLQDPPLKEYLQAKHLFTYLEILLPALANEPQEAPKDPLGSGLTENARSAKATLLLAAAHVFEKLAPLLKNAYVVEACLLKFLVKFCEVQRGLGEQTMVLRTLDLLWGMMQEHEIKPCLERLTISLLSAYRFSPVTPDFKYQELYLIMTLAVLSHEATRKHLLKYVLFDKIKFPVFLHVKPPDDNGLASLIPDVWWGFIKRKSDDGEDYDDDVDLSKVDTVEEGERRKKYTAACDELNRRVRWLEDIQTEMLKVLLINNDNSQGGASSRFVFLFKFREFLKENSSILPRAHMVNQCPLPVSLCFFHRLVRAMKFYWNKYAETHPGQAVNDSDAYVPICKFYDESIQYFEIQRLGGLLSHLKKTYKEELHKAKDFPKDERGNPLALHQVCIRENDRLLERQRDMYQDKPTNNPASAHSLVELLDGVVMLYNIAAHKQLGKMCTLRDTVHEYAAAYEDTRTKLATCPGELQEVVGELERAHSVFSEKTTEQARHMAWVIGVIYAKDKQEDVYWLLKTVLNTIERASAEGGILFAFMPDFYVDSCLNAYNALRGYFHPTRRYQNLPDFNVVLKRFGLFLGLHFADARIVNADIKDTIVQALACFVCYPLSLRSLETIPEIARLDMTKHLLVPYENRSWAQTNWILVRLWKGCGFGFRYKHLPHLLPAKNQQQEIGSASLQKPFPSEVYQKHVACVLRKDPETATKLIDSLLNQLNWAFSEFIGMLQELQQIASRPTASYIDSRQLKICATCFDISVGLLRVLEMIVSLVPEMLTDWSLPNSELLLCRLFQLLSQVLNRVTSRSNTFDMVVAAGIPGLETVDHFPILTAVSGIIVELVVKTSGKSQECAVAALLAESGFQLSCLEFLLGDTGMEASAAHSSNKKAFSFKNYKEVNDSEVGLIESLISVLKAQEKTSSSKTTDVDEESLCEICYARPKSVVFKPCGHQSCRACISHHMLNKKDCFFCKTQIDSVIDSKAGKPVKLS